MALFLAACGIVKNVEFIHDINDDRKLNDTERRGDDRGGVAGARAFDDNPDGDEFSIGSRG